MANNTVVVDPVTRIEGHLRIEAETEQGKITRALSSGTMVRGLEIILRDRDPRDAWVFAQRICGVCTLVHAIARVRVPLLTTLKTHCAYSWNCNATSFSS